MNSEQVPTLQLQNNEGLENLTNWLDEIEMDEKLSPGLIARTKIYPLKNKDNWNESPYLIDGPRPRDVIQIILNDVLEGNRKASILNTSDILEQGFVMRQEYLSPLEAAKLECSVLLTVSVCMNKRNAIFVDADSDVVIQNVILTTNEYDFYLYDGMNWYVTIADKGELNVLVPGEVISIEYSEYPTIDELEIIQLSPPILEQFDRKFCVTTIFDSVDMIRYQQIIKAEGDLDIAPIEVTPGMQTVYTLPAQQLSGLTDPQAHHEFYLHYHSKPEENISMRKRGYKVDGGYVEVFPTVDHDHVFNVASLPAVIAQPNFKSGWQGYKAFRACNVEIFEGKSEGQGMFKGTLSVYLCASKRHRAKYVIISPTYIEPLPAGALQYDVYEIERNGYWRFMTMRGIFNGRTDWISYLKRIASGVVVETARAAVKEFSEKYDSLEYNDLAEMSSMDVVTKNVKVMDAIDDDEIPENILWAQIPPLVRYGLCPRNYPNSRNLKCKRIHRFTARSIGHGMIQLACGFVTTLNSPTIHWHSCVV
uniref:Uncharacterized protein n=1 Tax=Operophtera brumata cypovirus 19 TaxID=352246 RepID=Q30C68_9REOV|nr:unknown [Operophtera brumata cypovirus 19]